jgi:hypothetical protein
VCIQNRYKLNKKYRKLLAAYGDEPDTLESKAIKAQAKVKDDEQFEWNEISAKNVVLRYVI